MNSEEKMEIVSSVYEKVKEWVTTHETTAPSTERRIIPLEQQMGYINTDLKDIKTAINKANETVDSTKTWLIITLFSILSSAMILGFWMGSWKGGIEERVNQIQANDAQLNEKLETHLLAK